MKKIKFLLFAMLFITGSSFAQSQKIQWNEKIDFLKVINLVNPTPEKIDFALLRQNADNLYNAAKALQASAIPSNYNKTTTVPLLALLTNQCNELQTEVKNNAVDNKLREITYKIHISYNKIDKQIQK